MDIDEIRERYAHMDEAELKDMALYQMTDLTQVGKQVLRDELVKRGLMQKLENILRYQSGEIQEKDLIPVLEKVRTSACPLCGKRDFPLNIYQVRFVKFKLVHTTHDTRPVLACLNCLEAIGNREQGDSLMGFASMNLLAIALTITAVAKNAKAAKAKEDPRPTALMIQFVLSRYGQFRDMMDQGKDLMPILAEFADSAETVF